MAKPISLSYTFGTQPGPVPLSYLDSNFSTLTTSINDTLTYSNYLVDTGTANSYAVAFSGSLTTSYTAGLLIEFKVANTNTGASTLNVNSLGNKSIVNLDGSALPAGRLVAGAIALVQYDGTNFQLLNSSGSVTSVGGTGSVNGITLTGTVTSSGNLTLGGALSGVSLTSQVTGTLPIANGGTGSTSTTYCNLGSNVTGTLPVANGGTGQTSYTNGQLLIGNTTGNTLTKATLTAGSGISITNGAGSITVAATASTGDITFSTNTISTANTNQSMILDPNGTGRILLNATSDIGSQGSATAVQISGSSSSTLYPLLVQTLSYPRANITLWNNDSGRGSNNAQYVWFYLDAAENFVGSITYNNSAGQVNYNQTSDRRIKTIYGPTTNSGALIDGLKVYDGKMALGTLTYPMMIADEVQQVTPYCVTGQPNAVDDSGKPVYQQVDYSSLVPLLIAELQSLRARVAELEKA